MVALGVCSKHIVRCNLVDRLLRENAGVVASATQCAVSLSCNTVTRSIIFETAAGDILLGVGILECHPARSTNDVVSTVNDAAIEQDTCADTRTNSQIDRILATASCALPYLAQNVAGTVALDTYGQIGTIQTGNNTLF